MVAEQWGRSGIWVIARTSGASAYIRTFSDYTTSGAKSATSGIYRQDWTAKPVVGVIETVIVENEAFLAAAGESSFSA